MYRIYQIKQGDTLESILNRYNTTEEVLKKINGINGTIDIIPGNYIIVPVRPNNLFSFYEVQKEDTLYGIAKKFSTTATDLALLNGIDENDYLYPKQELVVPNEDVSFYMTKEGDSILSASEALNTNPASLILQNETIYLLPEQLLIYKKGSSIEK